MPRTNIATCPRYDSLVEWLEDPAAPIGDLDQYLWGHGVPPSLFALSTGKWWLGVLDRLPDAPVLRHELAVRLGRWIDEMPGHDILYSRDLVIVEALELSRFLGRLPNQPLRDPLLRFHARGGVDGRLYISHRRALLLALAANQPDSASAQPWLEMYQQGSED